MTGFLSVLAAGLFLLASAAFVLQARLLGDLGTAFPTASFMRLAALDLLAFVLALPGAAGLLGPAVLPPWAIVLALVGCGVGGLLVIRLLRARFHREQRR